MIQLAQRHQSPESVRRSWFQGAAHFAAKGVPDLVPKVALVSIASLSAIFSQMAYPVFSIKDSSNFDSENAPCLCVERAPASHQKARPLFVPSAYPVLFQRLLPLQFEDAICVPAASPILVPGPSAVWASGAFPASALRVRPVAVLTASPPLASKVEAVPLAIAPPVLLPMGSHVLFQWYPRLQLQRCSPVPAPIASSALAPRVRFASNVPCLSGFQ